MTGLQSPQEYSRDLRRTIRLFKGFRKQYADPNGFYSYLAEDTASLLAQYEALRGRRILDVGSGPGYFSDEFRHAGATCCSMELNQEMLSLGGRSVIDAIIGDGQQMPIGNGAFDICHSSNVIEHVPHPRAFLSEMLRVVRPGGLVFLAFTNWYSPFGGHDTSPWHYFGGAWATRRFERKHGRPPLNRYGVELFRLDIGDAIKWVHEDDRAVIIDAFPRYYPAWTRPIVRVSGLREFLTWNLVLVIRKRPQSSEVTTAAGDQDRRT